ncbi:MAG: hypothetical protein NVS9B4_10080 [Candidatus Acidiferrum sp.]
MSSARLRILGAWFLSATSLFVTSNHTAAQQTKLTSGKLAGVVRDSTGTPRMGATVEVLPEGAGFASAQDLLTNARGVFRGDKLSPGFYSVRVTLAGFLPFFQEHVRIASNLTTVVRVELDSLFASLDQLRRQPISGPADADDWKWVLRSAPSMRPVLEWMEDGGLTASRANSAESGNPRFSRARLDFTGGARRAFSPSSLASAPATAFAYDQGLNGAGRLVFAGQMSYNPGATKAGGIATVWLPTGSVGTGPYTAFVLREAKLDTDGPVFRGIRIDQGGKLALTDGVVLNYGAEYVLVGLGTAASSIRPRAELDLKLSGDWQTAIIFSSLPAVSGGMDKTEGENASLTAAIRELDAFPALLWHNGHPVLQSGWHEEVALQGKIGTHGKLQVAAFHDDNRHVAVYGRGENLPEEDYFQSYSSRGFAYDGASSSGWGGRLAFREKLASGLEWQGVYTMADALVPNQLADGVLRDVLRSAPRHALGASLSTKVPRLGTKVDVGYEWVNGPIATQIDTFGQSLTHLDPFLHVGFRQPLPKFVLGRWEAIANCDNLLAQGYVPVTSKDGRVVLAPAFRSFRGGLSVQF